MKGPSHDKPAKCRKCTDFIRKEVINEYKRIVNNGKKAGFSPGIVFYAYFHVCRWELTKNIDKFIDILINLTRREGISTDYLYALGNLNFIKGLNELSIVIKNAKILAFTLRMDNAHFKLSLSYFLRALKILKKDAHINIMIAACYCVLGNMKSYKKYIAKIDFDNINKLEKKFARILLVRLAPFLKFYQAMHMILKKKYNGVIDILKSVPDMEGESLYIFFLSIAYINTNRHDEALKILKKIRKLIPNPHLVYDIIGRLYMMMHKYEQSSLYFAKAAALYSKCRGFYDNRENECNMLYEFSSGMSIYQKGLSTNNCLFPKILNHFYKCKEFIVKSNLYAIYGDFIALPYLVEIDERIYTLRNAVSLADLRIRIENILDNMISLEEKYHLLAQSSLRAKGNIVAKIFMFKFSYIYNLAKILCKKYSMKNTIQFNNLIVRKYLTRDNLNKCKFFFHDIGFSDITFAIHNLEQFSMEIANKSLDKIPENRQISLLKILFSDFKIIDGRLSLRCIDNIETQLLQKLITNVETIKEKQACNHKEIIKFSKMVPVLSDLVKTRKDRATPIQETLNEKKIRIFTHGGEMPANKLRRLERNKHKYHIWVNTLSGEIIHRCYPINTPRMTPVATRVFIYLLKNYNRIVRWDTIFELFSRHADKYVKIDRNNYKNNVHHWMWEITSIKHGTFDDCFVTKEAYSGYQLKEKITFCLILNE